jgi:signal transduction histidine kinase
LKHLWSQFLDSRVITWQAYIFPGLVTIGFAPELVYSINLEEAQLRRVSFLLAHVALGIVLVIANFTYLRRKTVREAPVFSIATVLLASLVFVVSIRVSSEYILNLTVERDFGARATSGLFALAIAQFVMAVVISETAKFRRVVDHLEVEIRKGQRLEIISVERLEALRARIAGEVTSALNKAFANLGARNNLELKSKQLRDLVDEVIKPLGKNLANREPDEKELQANDLQIKKLRSSSARMVLYAVARVRPFDYKWAPIALVVFTNFSRLWSGGAATPLSSLAFTWANVALFMWFGTLIQKNLQPKLSERVWLGVVTAVTTTAAAFDALATQLVFGQFESTRFLGLFVSNLLALSVSSIVRGVSLERLRVVEELEEATNRVAWMNARLTQLIWVEKRRLSRMVHGDIQSRIIATALSIELSEKSEADTKAALESLRLQCEQALMRPVQAGSLASFIEALQTLWQATVSVENRISPDVLAAIENDDVMVDTVSELIREGITNAVKHGKAGQVSIAAKMYGSESSQDLKATRLQLIIQDNGSAGIKDAKTEPGQGSELFDQICLSWNLSESADGHLLEAQIPMKIA